MVSVASAGTSPHSGYDYLQTDSNGDPDENLWTMVQLSGAGPNNNNNNNNNGAGGLFPSPTSGSMSSWAYVDANGQLQQASPGTLSPLNLNLDVELGGPRPSYSSSSFSDQATAANTQFSVTSAPTTDAQFMTHLLPDQDFLGSTGNLLFDQFNVDVSNAFGTFPAIPLEQQQHHHHDHHHLRRVSNHSLQTNVDFEMPASFRSTADVSPWNATEFKAGESPMFVMEDPSFASPSPPMGQSPSASPPALTSPHSPVGTQIKQETSGSADVRVTKPISIRKVRDSRVQKKKSGGSESPHSAGSAGTATSGSSKFLIVTPDSVNAHAGRPNPWECFEAMRPSQRGRKGPLATDTKENALQVRRLGACFCCHARKVKCDKERPCRNCKKLTHAVPQVVCWQFQDFLPVLFPDFFRGHFRKDEMARFMAETVDSFTLDGSEKACTVELFSGPSFATTLTVRANFFTPRSADALQHWHLGVGRNSAMDLQARAAVPIGLDLDGSVGALKDDLKKTARAYIDSLVQESTYAEQVTDSLRHTHLPRRVLRLVQNYSYRCDAPMVKKALSIYAMHYVMSRHLCLTRQTIAALAPTGVVPQDVPWVTPRVLNRQLKAVVDEMLMREMTQLFEAFGKSLKPKSRKEWAPCLAAFLVLCLFMEAVETTADSFVIAENEVHLRQHQPPRYTRAFALDVNRELENLPFKQFAYQFHQIYQTHSKDASARSFNPLLDDACFEQAELDPYSMEMVWQLRKFITEDHWWHELDYLTVDPILPNQDAHPYPRDVSCNYTGRLVAKFLLSFTDEKYIFGSK